MSQQKKIDIPAGACRFEAPPAQVDAETGRFTLVPFDGQVFEHWWWGKMTFAADGIRMRKNVIPAFKGHDSNQLVGEIDQISNDGKRIELSGAFLDTESAKEVRATNKLEWECSLAFDMASAVIEEVGASANVEVNGAEFAGPGYVIREAELHETSFTHFGAVPGTETAFKEGGDKVSVSIFSKEDTMSEDLQKAQDEATAQAIGLFSKMSAMCEDKAFVAECYEKKMDLQEFQTALIEKQNAAISQLAADLEESKKEKLKSAEGTAPVDFSGEPAKPEKEEELTFVQLAHKIKKDENISIAAAYSQVARKHPELYAAHIDSCPVAKTQKK